MTTAWQAYHAADALDDDWDGLDRANQLHDRWDDRPFVDTADPDDTHADQEEEAKQT